MLVPKQDRVSSVGTGSSFVPDTDSVAEETSQVSAKFAYFSLCSLLAKELTVSGEFGAKQNCNRAGLVDVVRFAL